jgi:hypothetical protein
MEIAKCKLQIEQEEERLARWAERGMVGNPAPRVAAARQPWAVIYKPFRLIKHLMQPWADIYKPFRLIKHLMQHRGFAYNT